jgi:hypothetical protein
MVLLQRNEMVSPVPSGGVCVRYLRIANERSVPRRPTCVLVIKTGWISMFHPMNGDIQLFRRCEETTLFQPLF